VLNSTPVRLSGKTTQQKENYLSRQNKTSKTFWIDKTTSVRLSEDKTTPVKLFG
jgi:hypothetical protein